MTFRTAFRVYTQTSEEIEAHVALTIHPYSLSGRAWLMPQRELDGHAQAIAQDAIAKAQRETRLWALGLSSPVWVLERRSYRDLERAVMGIEGAGYEVRQVVVPALLLTHSLPPPPPPPPAALPAPTPEPPERPKPRLWSEELIGKYDPIFKGIEELLAYRQNLHKTHPGLFTDPNVGAAVEANIDAELERQKESLRADIRGAINRKMRDLQR